MTTESTDCPAAPSKIQKTQISSKENWAPVAGKAVISISDKMVEFEFGFQTQLHCH